MFLFFPVGDHPNPRRTQWITRILLGINIAVYLFITAPYSNQGAQEEYFRDPAVRRAVDEMWQLDRDRSLRSGQTKSMWLAQVSRYDVFVWRYGFKPGRFDLVALFVCMFLHANFLHLAGNMLFLWIYGDNVEARAGIFGYLLGYLGTGVVATLAFAALNSDSMVPLVGASGAISGLLGFYLIWFPHNLIRVFVWFIFFIQIIYVRAIWVLLIWFLWDNVAPLLMERSVGAGSGVAFAAHIGGFLAGAAAGWAINLIKGSPPAPRPAAGPGPAGSPWRRTPVHRSPAEVVEDAGSIFKRAIREHRMEDAAHSFARIVREGGRAPEPDHVFRLGRWLYENRFVPDAAAVFRYYIKNFPRGPDLDRVHLGLGILLAREMGQPAAAREHLLAALDLTQKDSALAATAREELARIGG